MFFTPGNIITLILSCTLVIVFRQLDKNNRSIEKVKKFGDKLKEDLEAFIKEKTGKLEESTISLDVEQQRAIAAVKRLESIREDITRREEALLQRTQAIADMGKRVDTYEQTIKQLMEMTSAAEENLKRIASESDFADSLGRKILASRKQIEEISAAIPALRDDFARQNKIVIENIHAETIAGWKETVRDLSVKIESTRSETENILNQTTTGLTALFQKGFAEAAKRADSLEDSSFQKLKEQASERLAKYKAAIEEKTAALNELAREKLQDAQHQLKAFRSDWQSESSALSNALKTETAQALAAARADIDSLKIAVAGETAALSESLQTETASLSNALKTETAEALAAARADIDSLKTAVAGETAALSEYLQTGTAALSNALKTETAEALAAARADIARLEEAVRTDTSKAAEIAKTESARIIETLRSESEREIAALRSDSRESVETLRSETFDALDASRAELLSSLSSAQKEVSSSIDELRDESQERLSSIKSEIARFVQAAQTKISATEQDHSSRLASLESSLRDSESAAQERSETLLGGLNERVSELDSRVASISSAIENEIETFERSVRERLETAVHGAEDSSRAILNRIASMDESQSASLSEASSRLEKELEQVSSKISGDFSRASGEVQSSLSLLRSELADRLQRFETHIGDVERLDGELRNRMADTARQVQNDFSGFVQEQQNRYKEFSERFLSSGETLSARMQSLEQGLNELKARAYENVSEKLKVFEDDFFSDLARRGEAITAALDNWKSNVDARLDALTAESESSLKETTARQSVQFKERLSDIAEQYRAQSDRLEEQISAIESELRGRITASDQSLLSFVEQYRAEFEQARSKAAQHAQTELDAHAHSIQEALRRQEREIEQRTKEFAHSMDASRSDAETLIEGIRSDFSAWQAKNEQNLASARALVEDRVAALETSAAESISNIQSSWESSFREFLAGTEDERAALAAQISSLRDAMSKAGEDFNHRSAEALKEFRASYQTMSAETERQIRETGIETDQTLRSLKLMVQEIRETVDQNRDKLFQKLQSDAADLSKNLEEIDRKQKGFIAQTKIFERADQLKVALESDIESLRAEVSRLDVYRDSMNSLEQQYNRVRKLEEEATQKVSKVLSEKKRIDLLETDFTNLMALSESVDRKMAELTVTDDDIQQYQVQIRRFEDSIAEVNGRYERLEKKGLVLDQTVVGIDRAFETLKEFESELQEYRKSMSVMPGELTGLRGDVDALLEEKNKIGTAVERLSTLDSTLSDIEERIEKMQKSREWLARTETRLEEISKQSQDQLKLLGDILKEDGPAKKTKGAPPVGIRENVVKLAHQGWKVDEIARALHLSRGEVELILELPQK